MFVFHGGPSAYKYGQPWALPDQVARVPARPARLLTRRGSVLAGAVHHYLPLSS
jgi:hypothetical protein